MQVLIVGVVIVTELIMCVKVSEEAYENIVIVVGVQTPIDNT